MIKLAVSGALGRMGQRIIALSRDDKEIELVCALEREGHSELGRSLDGGIKVSADDEGIARADVLIEFSSPAASLRHLSKVVDMGKKMVIGTTGFSSQEISEIEQAAKKTAIVSSPNMSVGVNVLFGLLAQAAQKLPAGDYRVSVSERHHIHKKDSPSGTAKRLAGIVNEYGFGLGAGDIDAAREGEVVGDHKIVFESAWDRLELSHSAKTRDIFARGAIEAAKWVMDRPAGLYGMGDVIV